MLEGGCLCGDVRYRIDGKVGPLAYCHCKQCQRASGTAFGANASVRKKYWSWIRGRDQLREFESSPKTYRAFCSRCGSPIYKRSEDDPDSLRVRLGTLDSDPGRRPFGHFWISSKAAWHPIHDDLPRYDKGSLPDTDAD